jgi:hypothetical protein
MTDISGNHPLHAAGFALATAAAAKALGYQTDRAIIGGVVVGGGAYAYMSRYGHSLPTTSHPSKLSSYSGSAAPKPTVSSSINQAPVPAPLFSPSLEAKLAELRSRLPPPPTGPLKGTTFVQWYGSSKA